MTSNDHNSHTPTNPHLLETKPKHHQFHKPRPQKNSRKKKKKNKEIRNKNSKLTSTAPSLSPSQSPLAILSLIIRIISSLPRPFTKTTNRKPRNLASYSSFNFPNSSPRPCNCACSAALWAESTLGAPRRGCEARRERRRGGSVVRRERRWVFMVVIRVG